MQRKDSYKLMFVILSLSKYSDRFNLPVILQKYLCICFLFTFFNFNILNAQTNSVPTSHSSKIRVEANFTETDIELEKTSTLIIVNNVLRIVNKSNAVVRFSVDFTPPLNWNMLGKSGKFFELNALDSIFIPVRLIPNSIVKGNTHFVINAFVVSETGVQLNDAYFFIHLKKIVKWDLNIGPAEKIYFLNKKKSVPFNVNVLNLGNEQQEILLSTSDLGTSIILSDTNDRIMTEPVQKLNLKSKMDTTLYFKMGYLDGIQRNVKRIDADNFIPLASNEEKKYSLYIQSKQPVNASSDVYKVNKKVNFIRLSDQKKMNLNGGQVIPLLVTATVNNLMNGQPVMSMVLRGGMDLPDKSSITYTTQMQYSSYFLSKNMFRDNFFNIGYFHPVKGDVQIGTVGGFGVAAAGKGIRGNYNITKGIRLAAFVSGDPNLFNPLRKLAFGFSPNFTFKQQSLFLQYSHSIDKISFATTDFYSFRTAFKILDNHHITLGGNKIQSSKLTFSTPEGNMAFFNYNGNFLNNTLRNSLSTNFHSRNSLGSNNTSYTATNRIGYIINKKSNLMFQNNYNEMLSSFDNPLLRGNSNRFLYNQLFFARTLTDGNIMPNLFFNLSDINKLRSTTKGLGIDYSHVDPNSNFRYGLTMKAGVNHFVDIKNAPGYFTFQFSSFLLYKTFSFRGRYLYGPQSGSDTSVYSSNLNYFQGVIFSSQYQYQFLNPRYVLQTSANYNIDNQFYKQTFGLYPELHYADPSAWHFKIMLGYNLNSNIQKSAALSNENNPTSKFSSTFNLGLGVKKEFGLPIPKVLSKKKYTDIEFLAFYDVNGNHIKDLEEIVLENIVIRLGLDEVLTNEKGIGKLENIETGTYKINTFSLVDLKGWFSSISDTLVVSSQKIQYVPYVKGVKIYGNVSVDRTKYASDIEHPLDLSGIRITAQDGIKVETRTGNDGEFVLFAPYGAYILTMDESILGHRYSIGKNNLEINLKDGMESLYISFYIIEKTRKISVKKFDSKGQKIQEK